MDSHKSRRTLWLSVRLAGLSPGLAVLSLGLVSVGEYAGLVALSQGLAGLSVSLVPV